MSEKVSSLYLRLNLHNDVPVSLQRVCKELGIVVMKYPSDSIDGCCIQFGGKKFIQLKKGMPPEQERFVLAHEIAHLTMGHTFAMSDERGTEAIEREADRFARALLMPYPALWIRSIRGPLHTELIAREFYVGPEQAALRLVEVGLPAL